MVDFSKMHWNVITYCEREDAYGKMIPAEWFILNATYATREEAEAAQAKIEEDTKGTDADWPAAYANAKIVHDDELAQYGLKPLNGRVVHADPRDYETNPWSLTNRNGYWHD